MEFTPLTAENAAQLRPYYENCNYRLCEYSVGVKLMWSDWLHPAFAFAGNCLIVCNRIEDRVLFDYPVPGEDGDVEAALLAIEKHCAQSGQELAFGVVPEAQVASLLLRYPRIQVTNERPWKDYLYHSEDLANFAGRRYSGQRNHINKFRKEHPDAAFVELTPENTELLERFWADYEAEFRKESTAARKELALAKQAFALLGNGWYRAGGLLAEGRLVAISLAEKCGDTLVNHVEKALYSQAGAYPAMVQAFAAHYGGDCAWINREDDARDKGLRTSKLQYLPAELGSKFSFIVSCEVASLYEIPKLSTERLTLDALTEADKPAYNALCLDDERNRWWGYDYRKDLCGELTEDYFLQVAQEDFKARRAVNFAVRLDGKCIGEAVLYNPDWRGGMELGCRIAPEYAGHGYGTEAFAAVADWALYRLGLARVVAKCYHENLASDRMLSSCMRRVGADATFLYFEKTV